MTKIVELTLQNISLGYKDNTLATHVNLTACGGQLIALIGRNGTGKSTLLRSLAALAHPCSGDILLDGKSLFTMRPTERARQVAFVSTEIVRVPNLRVWDVVALGRSPYSSWSGALSDEDQTIVLQALDSVGMSDFKHKNLDTLSDGERGRIMIARAMAQESSVILLDEPTAFLDLPNRYHIIELLRTLAHDSGKIIILSTHELSIAMELTDILWVLAHGMITCGTPSDLAGSDALKTMMRL